MALTVTVSDLITQIRNISDMERTQFVEDAELVRYLDKSYRKLYMLIDDANAGYFETSSSLSLVSGQESYALPADFYKLTGVDLILSTDQVYTLKNINRNERNINKNIYGTAFGYGRAGYLIRNQNIVFVPIPDSSYSVTIRYVPDPTSITTTAQTLILTPSVVVNYLIVDVAIRCVGKEESDVTELVNERALLTEQIMRAVASQDSSFPLYVTDTSSMNGDGFFPWIMR